MKSELQISKENKTTIIRRLMVLLFAVSVLVFMFYGKDYVFVLKGSIPLKEFENQLNFEDTTNLAGSYINTTADNIQDYYVAFKAGNKESYYYIYEDTNSGLLISLKVDSSRKEEFDQLVHSKKPIEIKGMLSFINDSAVEVGRYTIEKDGVPVQDDIWKYVSPYLIQVDELSVYSIQTTKVIFYVSVVLSFLSFGVYIYLKTDSWKNHSGLKSKLKIKDTNEEASKDIEEVTVLSIKDNRILLGDQYIFFKENMYKNKYEAKRVDDIRWIRIKKFSLLIFRIEYVFLAVDKDGNEDILLVAKGKKEMETVIDKMIRKNDKIILGEIKELKEKNINLKNHKEKVMKIVNQKYKDNTYDYMKENKR